MSKSKRSSEVKLDQSLLRPTEPMWPTTLRSRDNEGRCIGTDNSVWLYRAVPCTAISEAKTTDEMLNGARPLLAFANELAAITPARTGGRRTSKGSYRNVHILAVNIPVRFRPAPGRLESFLGTSFPRKLLQRRALLVGVQLIPSLVSTHGAAFGEQVRSAVNSVIDTFTSGVGTPLEDFDQDYERISSIMQRSGLVYATDSDMRIANSWFTLGGAADVVQLHHASHSHIFKDPVAVRAAANAGVADCENWPYIPGEHAVTFASVAGFEFNGRTPDNPDSLWGDHLCFRGAQAVSIRGLLEPAKVTGMELTSQRKKNIQDLETRLNAGKMTRADHEEKLVTIEEIEARYQSGGGSPTLTDCSVVVALDGIVKDIEGFSRAGITELSVMQYLQQAAMTEMMLCSPVRANPRVHDLPMDCVATAGLNSLSKVGDPAGALVGFTEKDGQPAYLSPEAASAKDASPLTVVPGMTGSGKATALTTVIPTPSGSTTMGELRIGDEVLGRDGKPCRVTYLSPVNENPDAYRITFSDGQEVLADFDHQWVVSDFYQRNANLHPHRKAHLERARRMRRLADDIDAFAARAYAPDDEIILSRIVEVFAAEFPDADYTNPGKVASSLRMLDVPCRPKAATVDSAFTVSEIHKTDPVKVMPGRDALLIAAKAWGGVAAGDCGVQNAARWGGDARRRAVAARSLADRLSPDEAFTSPELARMIVAESGVRGLYEQSVARHYRASGRELTAARRSVTAPRNGARTITRTLPHYPARQAFNALAERIRQRYYRTEVMGVDETVLTTGEMLARGLSLSQGHSRFAVRIAAPLDLPDADLPVPPYTFGAWLGDGSKHHGHISGIDREIWEAIESDGYEVTHHQDAMTRGIRGLARGLRELGVLYNKHIPDIYLRGSHDQRLALLQGLMDTDGSISREGSCELSLSDRQLAEQALRLVRSLGIKASCNWDQPAGYRDAATGELVAGKNRHRIHFTTDQPVFRLKRKAVRLPVSLRETARWNYITSIEPVTPVPMRCIQVDSPDHTYLVEDFVPTSNTIVLQWLAQQFARLGSPVIIVDPKQGSDLSGPVLLSGGTVHSLDELAAADGVFDPLRFAVRAEAGIDMAASMLMAINPWGTKISDYETPLTAALAYGVSRGAKTIGQALYYAKKETRAPADMIERVFSLMESSPMFRACCGMDPDTPGLRVSDGITLIKVGDAHLDLPEPGAENPPQQQRIALALVRMMVYGSAMAVSGRTGVVMLDESWVFLGAGRSEVERLGRLARSQGVLPMLFTQRTTDALQAGLTGYISRGLILPMEDPAEARAALELFKIEPTAERMARLTAKAEMSSTVSETGTAPNWYSMRALFDPVTRKNLRGTIALYSDLAGRAIPTEICIPSEFLLDMSTTPQDVARRRAEKERQARAAMAAREAERSDRSRAA